MSLRHLTFANVAAASALAIALAGGGVAVGAGLAKNSVGSKQVQPNSLKSADIKNDSLTGKDIKESKLDIDESKLGSVPAVDTVATKTATAAPGQTKTIFAKGTFVVEVTCTDTGGGTLESSVNVRTTADNAAFDANDYGDEYEDFDVATGPAEVVSESDSTSQNIEDGGFAAISAAGQALTGHAFAVARPGNTATCLGGGSFIS